MDPFCDAGVLLLRREVAPWSVLRRPGVVRRGSGVRDKDSGGDEWWGEGGKGGRVMEECNLWHSRLSEDFTL